MGLLLNSATNKNKNPVRKSDGKTVINQNLKISEKYSKIRLNLAKID